MCGRLHRATATRTTSCAATTSRRCRGSICLALMSNTRAIRAPIGPAGRRASKPASTNTSSRNAEVPMSHTCAVLLSGLSAAGLTIALAETAGAQTQNSLEQRRANYAPWSPDQMPQRRKEQGLIGPGTTKPVPPPAFPSYLKKPESIEQLMPAARAAARQPAGRTPLGLVDPGKTLLIVVGLLMGANPDLTVQAAMKRAIEERGVKCIILTSWELLGISHEEYLELRRGVRTSTIADGQRELEFFFTITGAMPDPHKGREWVRQQDPELYAATWPEPKLSSEKLAAIARDFEKILSNALVAWLDQHREVDWIVWRGGGRPNTRKALRHHGEKFLGNYTYVDVYDLMSQVPSFPSDVWRLIETKTMEPLAFVDRVEVTDPEGTAFGYDVDEESAKNWAAGVYQQGHLYMFPAQGTGDRKSVV